MPERIVIAELEMNTKAMQDANAKLIQDIAKLRAAQKDLMKETDGMTNATDEQAKAFVENDAAIKNLQAQYANNKKIIAENVTGIKGLNDAIGKEVSSVNEARKNNADLLSVRNQLNAATEEGAAAIEAINKKIDENTEFIRANVSEAEKQKMNIGDYTNQIKGAFADLNIFNGGLMGFIARSQEAGGAGNLLKNSFNNIKDGIVGATKSSLAFIATPLGAVIAAIALVVGVLYSAFKNFTPIVDKCEQAMAALEAVFSVVKNTIVSLVTGTKSLGESLSGLAGNMKDAAVAAAELKKAQQDLEDAQGVLEISTARANRQINEYLLKSKDRTLSEAERIKYLNLAQKTEKDLYNQRKQVADEELRQAQQKLIVGSTMTAAEIRMLKEKGYEYAKQLQDKYLLDDKDIDNLKDALIKKENILNDSISLQEKAQNKVNALYEKQDAEREKAAEKAKQKAEEARKKAEDAEKKRQDDLIKIMNAELQKFILTESKKSKTLEKSLQYEDIISQKRIAILEKERQFGKKNKAEYEAEKLQIEIEALQKKAELTVKNLQDELALYLAQNQSRLDGAKTLTDLLVEEERNRQQRIFNDNLEILQKEKEARLISDKDYEIQRLNLITEYNKQKKDLNDKYEAQKREEQKLIDQTNYDADVLTMQERKASEFELELARIAFEEQTKLEAIDEIQLPIKEQKLIDNQAEYDQGLISEMEYNANRLAIIASYENQVSNVTRAAAVARANVDNAVFNARLSGAIAVAQGVSQVAGEETAVGKAAAIAATAIATYQSATNSYNSLSGIPIVGPALGAVAAGLAIASGLANVAKITGISTSNAESGFSSIGSGLQTIGKTTLPKAEKGAMFTIGGNRHSAGGTKFYGEDGTAFEAEQGEILAVMNRNSSKLFMDFNDRFGGVSGNSGRNYFANGGIVTRNFSQSSNQTQPIDIDALATKIGVTVSAANASLPNPVVAVTDINLEQSSYAQVVNGADVA